ncbi:MULTISPECIES: hypothetical protein [unclassified Yoonia]|uniref:hypothetical protein n=1 Tax=unclassified Yoonia TaxID=2629118 RepID=UPI002B002E41|nr:MULTISPECIES: hypothetical protein [unclassified Yoonia]
MTGTARPSDPARDFCQWPYERPRDLAQNAIRQEDILFRMVAEFDKTGKVLRVLHNIQQTAGRFNTVWGLKFHKETPSLELYFYDYERENRSLSVSKIKSIIPSIFTLNTDTYLEQPYFMWSFELNFFEPLRVSKIDIYCNGTGGTISGGICYECKDDIIELKNLYSFFESKKDTNAIQTALQSSPRIPSINAIPTFIRPNAAEESMYVLATKRRNDAIYLSRITIESTLNILSQVEVSPTLIQFMKENKQALSHHLFDIGLDFRLEDKIAIEKIGLYGIL